MKKILLGILLLCVIPIYAQETVKVITFNVRSFEPDFDTKPYADLLKGEQADFICLNEVENRSSRQQKNGKFRDVVQELALNLHMFGTFGYSYNLSNKQGEYPEANYKYCMNELYGNAILSRYPIMNVISKQLPRPKGSADQRSVIAADVLLPSGKTIRIISTHLDHIGGQLEQAKVITSDEITSTTLPTILTGDMNQGVGSSVINQYLTRYERMDNDDGTYMGMSKIDFIFGSKGQWNLQSCKVLGRFLNQKELSDHCPVLSILQLK